MKTIMITGCARGMGQLMAETFLADGWRVVATDVNFSALEGHRFADRFPDRALVRRLDVSDYDAWESLLAEVRDLWGGVDVLVNNAGVLLPRFCTNITRRDIDLQLDVNARGTIYGTTLGAREMVARGSGHLINIVSIAGIAPAPGLGMYCASKFAARGFTLSVAYELREKGISVTAICPDAVNTQMVSEHLHNDDAGMVFSGSLLQAEDVLRAVQRAIRTRPTEIVLPLGRGLTAKLAGFFPALGFWVKDFFHKKGRKKQASLR